VCRARGARFRARTVEHFYHHPLYLRAVAERIRVSLGHFDHPGAVHLVFSAHGLPVSFIERGDPYQRQVEATVRQVMSYGGWPNAHTVCYQSKVGPQKWLQPSLDAAIERLAAAGEKCVLVVPVSFVTEHIESLHEINIETRAEAVSLGIEEFGMVPAVGDAPEFIAALADLTLVALRAAPSEQTAAASRA
jgi:ferrochelatase